MLCRPFLRSGPRAWELTGVIERIVARCSRLVPFCEMPRFSMDQLRWKALGALEDELKRAIDAPVRRTRLLSSTLAFLSNFADDRAPFDRFWREIGDAGEARWHNANAALDAIHTALGIERDEGPRPRGLDRLHRHWETKKQRKPLRFMSAVLSGMESRHKEEAAKPEE